MTAAWPWKIGTITVPRWVCSNKPTEEQRVAAVSKVGESGFSLVEVALVLVVVGLLLAGFLKGQELIASTRVRNIADQNADVQAAYFGFIDRYRAVPGDMSGDDACARSAMQWPGARKLASAVIRTVDWKRKVLPRRRISGPTYQQRSLCRVVMLVGPRTLPITPALHRDAHPLMLSMVVSWLLEPMSMKVRVALTRNGLD
jgi:prepilin-type N-terminal cleavage/methylation domain-containing protein